MADAPKKAKRRRRWLWLLPVFVVVAVVAVLALLQTPPVQRGIEARLSRQLSKEQPISVEITGLSGVLPLNFRIASIRLGDATGTWMHIRDVHVAISRAAMLRGRLHIRELAAGEVELSRAPVLPDSEDANPMAWYPPPPLPAWLRVEHAEVARLLIADTLAPQALALRLEGALEPTAEAPIQLDAQALDTGALSAALRGGWTDETISLSLSGEDAVLSAGILEAGAALGYSLSIAGPLSKPLLTARAATGPHVITASGAITPRESAAALTIAVAHTDKQDAAWLESEVALHLSEAIAARGSLRALPVSGHVPPALESLLAQGADAVFDLRFQEGVLQIEKANARVDQAEFSAQGKLDWVASKADMSIGIQAEDLGIFAGLAGIPLGGALRATATMQTDDNEMKIHAQGEGDAIALGDSRIPSAQFKADIVGGALEQLLKSPLQVLLTAEFPGLELQPGMPRDFRVATDVKVDSLEHIDIRQLEIGDGNLAAKAQGTLDLATRQGTLDATLRIDEIADYTAPFGLPGGGGVALTLQVAPGDSGGVLTATAEGRAEKITGLPEGVGGALGDAFTFQLRGNYDGAKIQIDALNAASKNLEIAASGGYALDSGTIQAKLDGAMADLGPLGVLVGNTMAGGAALVLEVSGTPDKIAANGELKSKTLVLGPVRADAAQVKFSLDELPAKIQGQFAVEVQRTGKSLKASATVARKNDAIQVSALQLDAGENVAKGQGQWDWTRQRGAGTLEAELPALGALRTWIDLPIDGAATLDVKLADDGELLDVSFTAAALEVPGLRMGTAQGKAAIRNPFAQASGTVDIAATALHSADLSVSQLLLKLDGPPTAVSMALSAEGAYQDALPFSVDATGQANSVEGSLALNTLSANVDARAIVLEAPATLRAKGAEVSLSPARFSLGGGVVVLEGESTGARVDARARWNDVPLALVELLGIVPYEGTSSGDAALGGTRAAPTATATFSVAGLRLPGEVAEAAPGLNAEVDAQVEAGVARVTMQAEIPDALQLSGTLQTETRWQLSPWEAALAPEAGGAGQLTGKGDLAAIPVLLGMEGHVLRGRLHVDLRMSGRLDAPEFAGGVEIAEGYYENEASGTIFDALTVRLEAGQGALRLAEFSGNDAAGGTLRATGEIALGPELPFSIQADLDNMRLIHRDEISARLGGKIDLKGDSAGARASGDLRVGPADVRLPDRLPAQQITTVEFREADAPDAETGANRETTRNAAPVAYPVALDLRCAIPGRVFVRGPGLDSEWEGNLNIAGTAQAPAPRGTLRVRHGRLAFLGREFDLRESTVGFNGASPPTPALNIIAVAEQRDITARVRLEGEFDSLNVTLSSDPPLPQDEVLSQVLFGRNLSEVTPFQALQLARYAPLFSSRVSGMRLLGAGGSHAVVDRLSIQSGAGLSDTSITAGKNLGDRLYLEVEQGTGSQGSAFSLEWLFAPNWSLRGRTGTNSEGGAGLFWKKNY